MHEARVLLLEPGGQEQEWIEGQESQVVAPVQARLTRGRWLYIWASVSSPVNLRVFGGREDVVTDMESVGRDRKAKQLSFLFTPKLT